MRGKMRFMPLLAAALTLALVGCQRAASPPVAGEVRIDVTENGFEPAVVKVPARHPITLIMTRKTDQTCARTVEFTSLKKSYELPLNQPVRITLPPAEEGTLSYQCDMHMVAGRLIVQ